MLISAITTRTEHCWVVVKADGRPVGYEDSEPHFDSEADAIEALPGFAVEGDPAPVVKRLDALCSSAVAACGYVYDEEGEGVEHWPSAEDLHAHLLTLDWRDLPDGQMHCSADPGVCDECDVLTPTPTGPEIPGQAELSFMNCRPNSSGGEGRG